MSPGVDTFSGEPEADLVVGRLNGVGSVDDVTANIDTQVTTDGSGGRVLRSGGSEHDATGLDGIHTFPDHGADGSRDHVFNERREEFLLGKIGVMGFHVGLSGAADLHSDELEALLFETSDNLTNNSSLDGIRLEHDESSLFGGLHYGMCKYYL